MAAEKTRFVLTYELCDGEVKGCIDVYDDPDKCFGVIFSKILDEIDQNKSNKDDRYVSDWKFPEMIFSHDDSNDNYYEVSVKYEDSPHKYPDIYRVFYLREEN